ncbi:uncharacterized protein VNE69_06220 [Vairimorpha necatrix]|uniref:Uncharacterized protein n=1 Tax=Vairimorpha necatrix TaxID=6039 RepID=A0AAX4JD72_9MICR
MFLVLALFKCSKNSSSNNITEETQTSEITNQVKIIENNEILEEENDVLYYNNDFTKEEHVQQLVKYLQDIPSIGQNNFIFKTYNEMVEENLESIEEYINTVEHSEQDKSLCRISNESIQKNHIESENMFEATSNQTYSKNYEENIHDNIQQIFSDEIYENISKDICYNSLIEMKVIVIKHDYNFIKAEHKIDENIQYIRATLHKFRKITIRRILAIKQVIDSLGFNDDKIVIDLLDLIIKITKFMIFKGKKYELETDSLIINHYCSLESWKIDTVCNTFNIPELFQLIYDFFNNKSQSEENGIIQILDEVNALKKNFLDFYEKKYKLYDRMKKLHELIAIIQKTNE